MEFGVICRNMASRFIRQRLGSTKRADISFVMDEGKIMEAGSHAELMQRNDVYAAMYNSQRRWYE